MLLLYYKIKQTILTSILKFSGLMKMLTRLMKNSRLTDKTVYQSDDNDYQYNGTVNLTDKTFTRSVKLFTLLLKLFI
jgi:hypothetical protein